MAGQNDQAMIDHLVKVVGIDEEEAKLRVSQDADLWFLHPERRFTKELQGEEGVAAWREAVAWAHWLETLTLDIDVGLGVTQLLWDLGERAEEALRRAEVRANEGG